jgi:hypothetical protein
MMGMVIAIGVGVVILFVAHVFEKRKNKTGESK